MDEILIEEKKYISSKQAAKITGYAKDYIGQLCREGRVPAQLVGRSWYVLESAIQDHRFGEPETDPEKEVKIAKRTPIAPTWEPPRYEAVSDDLLPSVNRLEDAVEPSDESNTYDPNQIQDSWREWFDRFDRKEEKAEEQEIAAEKIEEPELAPTLEEAEEEIAIPIHVYAPPPEDLLPHAEPKREPAVRTEKSRRGVVRTMQIAGMVLAIISAMLAVIGSGYLDQYILSNSQARIIAGVGLYNK